MTPTTEFNPPEGGERSMTFSFLIGMETSGRLREALRRRGVDAWSCDLLPSQDGSPFHIVGNVFDVVAKCWDGAFFHPTCTWLTGSAEWAYSDPDFVRFPGAGYHQKVKSGTPTGAARRALREAAIADVRRLEAVTRHIRVRGFENPVGALSTRWRKPVQTIQPYECGDDASKRTCLWFLDGNGNDLPPMPINPALRITGRVVNGVERWSNQTDSGQNRLSPGEDRWKLRSDTFPGVAECLADHLLTLMEMQPEQLSLWERAA